ncbi:DOMON-like domain-containing protein [Desulfopila sp. IMCC35006]|uniref:DOMON-like domain-containing protein n=1 Tax=Desulfopila sp. IMCC35006 TaxID=2569542 RepID=UPI0010AC81D1|nr:DOMON-like domain-containing protein [Desulfopila sp. IMCC35006]TKB26138.1 DOMON-like domain-containing protein [Desulfopila sp. IMCC35006]
MSSLQEFKLYPFAAGSVTETISISGSIARQSGALHAAFEVQGGLEWVNWLGTSRSTGRCQELWRHTCFELFFAIPGDPAYWEVNLSPNGCWNIYRFTGYRTGMREEAEVDPPVCHVAADGALFSLGCAIDCQALVDDSADLELAVSSVIQDTRGSISYWAIDHLGPEPDFHNRASFSMVLSGVHK